MHRISGLKFILDPRSSGLKNLMKKPAAACMKKVMKRPATVEQQTERSGRKADSHGHVRQRSWQDETKHEKNRGEKTKTRPRGRRGKRAEKNRDPSKNKMVRLICTFLLIIMN